MVFALFIIALLTLTAVNRLIGKSLLYPPCHFTALWSLLLSGVALCGDLFYSISLKTLTIYLLGAFAFSAGGAFRMSHQRSLTTGGFAPRIDQYSATRLLTLGLVVLSAAYPFYWAYLQTIAGSVRRRNFWSALRGASIARAESPGLKPLSAFLFDNLPLLAILLAFTAVIHRRDKFQKWRLFALILLGLLYTLSGASRAGAVTLVLGCVGIALVRKGSVSLSVATLAVLGFLAAFVPIAILRKTAAPLAAGVSQAVAPVWDSLLAYSLGPVVAFDAIVHDPSSVRAAWSIWWSALQLATRLGAPVDVASKHTDFVMIGPIGLLNVYTMYFSYYSDFGFLGVAVITALIGYFAVAIYQAALKRGPGATLLYGIVFVAICKSGYNESFFGGLNMWLKALLFSLIVYRFPNPLLRRVTPLEDPVGRRTRSPLGVRLAAQRDFRPGLS